MEGIAFDEGGCAALPPGFVSLPEVGEEALEDFVGGECFAGGEGHGGGDVVEFRGKVGLVDVEPDADDEVKASIGAGWESAEYSRGFSGSNPNIVWPLDHRVDSKAAEGLGEGKSGEDGHEGGLAGLGFGFEQEGEGEGCVGLCVPSSPLPALSGGLAPGEDDGSFRDALTGLRGQPFVGRGKFVEAPNRELQHKVANSLINACVPSSALGRHDRRCKVSSADGRGRFLSRAASSASRRSFCR